MPNPKRSTSILLGLLLGLMLAVVVYFTHWSIIYSLVYSIYVGFIDSLQLYELAWILATIDILLNFSILYSLILWILVTILVALCLRNINATLTILSIAVLLLGGTWLLFSIKYAFATGFSILFILSFFFWQVLMPLTITLGLAVLLSFPFWWLKRQRPTAALAPTVLEFQCKNCGAEYRSKPLICVNCGKENSIEAKSTENSETD